MPAVPAGRARPRHRASRRATAGARLRRTLRSCSRPVSVAVVLTGAVVGSSALAAGDAALERPGAATADAAAPVGGSGGGAQGHGEARESLRQGAGAGFGVSRGAFRPGLTAATVVPPDRRGSEAGVSGAARVEAPDDPREIAMSMLGSHGWPSSEFGCLDALWIGESNWDPLAENPTSGAYGIPQSLPPEKMAAAGSDWATNPVTQIEWGLSYIADSYGSPCAANAFKLANGWY